MANKQTRSFECPVCLEEYTDPRILPCYHTLCRRCLATQISTSVTRGQYNCPVCRSGHTVPTKGIDDIQKNFYMVEMMEMAQASRPKHPLCKAHTTEDLRFYCQMCKVPICRDCKVVGHEGHKINIISEVAKEKKAEAKKLLTDIEGRKKTINTQFAAYRGRFYREIAKADNILKETEDRVEYLRERLDKLLDDIKRDIENWKTDIMDEFKINRGKSNYAQTNLDRDIETITAAVGEPLDDVAIVRCNNVLLRQKTMVTENPHIPLEPAVPTDANAFRDSFLKLWFSANRGITYFEDDYYNKLKRVFSFPGNSGQDMNDSDITSRCNITSKKVALEDQPGPSGEPARKKARADFRANDTLGTRPLSRKAKPSFVRAFSVSSTESDSDN